jgi:DNA repair exonuclease SbcCD nuclease subunit
MPKFLHAADLHVDSPLVGLDAYEGAPAERIRGATRRALENLVKLALDEKVAFVVLAGDVYDTNPLLETALFFRGQMQRLADARIPVVIVRGNHDHAGIAPQNVRLPEGVTVLPHDQAATVSPANGVCIHGRSYPGASCDGDLVREYPEPTLGALNVGLLHTSLAGDPEHQRYAPTSKEELAARGYQYWALGHVHRYATHDVGKTRIVFPGNLQGRHARETGAKGAVIVAYEGETITSVEPRPLDVMRWHHVEVDVSRAEASGDVPAAVRAQVLAETARDRGAGRLCAVRVTVSGTVSTPLGLADRDLHEYLVGEIQQAGGLLWLEKARVRVATALEGRSELEARLEALASELAESPEARAQLADLVDDVRKDLRKCDRELLKLEQTDFLPGQGPTLTAGDATATLARALRLLAGELG